MCPKHYKRGRRGVPVDFDFQAPATVRFARFFIPGGADECWEWQGHYDQDGYGKFWWGACSRGAHRFSYEQATGTAVPPHMCVCHRCDNPPCVNPAHLFVGTINDNNQDKVRKGRGRGNNTGSLGDYRRRLTDEQVAAIRAEDHSYRGSIAAIARKYGISGEHARRILNGSRR